VGRASCGVPSGIGPVEHVASYGIELRLCVS